MNILITIAMNKHNQLNYCENSRIINSGSSCCDDGDHHCGGRSRSHSHNHCLRSIYNRCDGRGDDDDGGGDGDDRPLDQLR